MKVEGKCLAAGPALFALICVLGPGVSEAQAYIDPGTTTLLLSPGVLLGVLYAGIGICCLQFKRGFGWVTGKLLFWRRAEQPDPPESPADAAEHCADD